MTQAELDRCRKLLLKKGAEINDKLTRLLANEKIDIDRLLGKGKPGETPIERLRKFLDLVDGQIKRIRAGTYGTCVSCGAELPFAHLEQVPWIDTCQTCAASSQPA
jgi:RNA polymerase-binding transcription factor DksA